MKKTVWLTLAITLILMGNSLSAEERGIEFRSPEPYIDYEFEELQRTFLKKRTIQLATLKSLPLNQYPEEFIIELVNRIKAETKREVQRDMIKYLSKYLKYKKIDLGPETKAESTPEEGAFLLNKASINKFKGGDQKKEFDRKEAISMGKEGLKKETQFQSKEEKKTDEKMEKFTVEGRGENSVSFTLNNSNPFLGINSLTRNLMMTVDVVSNPKSVKYVDVTIYLKNIDTEMIYSLKRFSMATTSGKKNFSYLWEYPTINAGKYKLYTTVRFYDTGQRLVASKTQYWGNTNSSQKYIIMKN